ALADLPERNERQAHVGQRGQALEGGNRAEQQLDHVVVAARRAAAQKGEREGVGKEVGEQVGRFHRSWSLGDGGRAGRRLETPKAALGRPSRSLCVRAVSGPPGERSTTR